MGLVPPLLNLLLSVVGVLFVCLSFFAFLVREGADITVKLCSLTLEGDIWSSKGLL